MRHNLENSHVAQKIKRQMYLSREAKHQQCAYECQFRHSTYRLRAHELIVTNVRIFTTQRGDEIRHFLLRHTHTQNDGKA